MYKDILEAAKKFGWSAVIIIAIIVCSWILGVEYYKTITLPNLKPSRVRVDFNGKLISKERYYSVYEINIEVENVGDSSIFLNDGYLQATTYRIVLPEGMESFIDKDTSISNERETPIELNYQFTTRWVTEHFLSSTSNIQSNIKSKGNIYGMFFPEKTSKIFIYFGVEQTGGARLNPGGIIKLSRIILAPALYNFVNIEYYTIASKENNSNLKPLYIPSSNGISYLDESVVNESIKIKNIDERMLSIIDNAKLVKSSYIENSNEMYPVHVYKEFFVPKSNGLD